MSEYIEKSSLLQSLKSSGIASDFAMYKISNFPTADVVPVVHGEWVYDEFDIPHCSECGHEVMPNLISPFCPNCGAKMDGEELQNNE